MRASGRYVNVISRSSPFCAVVDVIHSLSFAPRTGITEGPCSLLYVSQIPSGSVVSIDAITGETKTVVGDQTERQAWGLWYYDEAIFVAGGGPSFNGGKPEVYVYNITSGMSLVNCSPTSLNPFGAFLNDVTVRGGIAYITDFVNGKLMTMNADDAISGTCTVGEVDLPANFDPQGPDDFGANGIVSYADGLLVAHEIDGSVWHITNLNDKSGPDFQEAIPDGGALYADGLDVLDDKLYVTQNLANQIGVFQLQRNGRVLKATLLGNLTSPDYDTPATSALYGGYIYSTNSRFASIPNITAPAENNVVGVKNTFLVECVKDGDECLEDGFVCACECDGYC